MGEEKSGLPESRRLWWFSQAFVLFGVSLSLSALLASTHAHSESRSSPSPSVTPSPVPSASRSPASSATPAAAHSGVPFQIEARTDIDKTVNGGVVRILVEAKSLPEGEKLVGEFEGTDFLFFALPPEQGAHRYEALLGIPHDRKPGKGVIRVKSFKGAPGATLAELSIEIEDGKYPLEHLKVDGKHVNPPKKVMARIKLEGSEVHKVFSRKTEERMWTGPFKFPIQSAITSPYGTKRMYNGEERNFHGGLDLKAAVGTEIHAPQDGIVYLAKDLYFTGNSVMIDHGYGLVTLYAHMSKLKVKVGQRVKTGDLLGLSGATGRVSGPHLHWQIYINSVKVSPLLFMKTLEEETVPRLK